jgi:hypothetical protein
MHVNMFGGEKMVSVTLAVTKDIREKMREHNDINWSEFIRKNISKKIDEIELMSNSKNEQEIVDWAVKLQKKSRKERIKQLKDMGLI